MTECWDYKALVQNHAAACFVIGLQYVGKLTLKSDCTDCMDKQVKLSWSGSSVTIMFEVSFADHFVEVFCDYIQESSIVTYYVVLYHPQACMFVNISPLESNVPETISTLEFGQNASGTGEGNQTCHQTCCIGVLHNY